MLPTPKASDGTHGGPNQRDSSGRYYLPGQAVRVDAQWLGTNSKDYGPAVRRWEEVTGHPAPCPTEPGTKGNRRLSPAFSEWMMGVGPGHVTDIVTDRNDALHVIGNGVVPRQAEAAFRFLMDDENWTDDMSIPIEVDERIPDDTEPVKADKPRGRCTGCAFDYQLGTARTGEHKGELVIRKHNSRTGPGLCLGASAPPYDEQDCACGGAGADDGCPNCSVAEEPHTEGCTPEARFGPPEETVTHVDTGLDYPDVVGVAPGGTPITVTRLDVDGAPVGEPFDAVGAITLCPSPVDPFTAPNIVYSDTPHEVVQDPDSTNGTLVLPTDWSTAVTPRAGADVPWEHLAAPHPQSMTNGIDAEPVPVVPDPWSAPAPASIIPESTTTVSGQPEPDRDRWGRYLIMGTAHTRATTFAKLGANTKAIEAWNERNVIRGLTLRPDLLMLANGLEVKRDRNDLNSIAAQAKDAAGSKVAANIGTAYHAFGERIDAGLHGLEAVPDAYRERVHQYVATVRGAGLSTRPEWIERTTAVRADQVGAPLPVAGTLDRIFQLPDGSLVIGDLKTGSDLSYGEMEIEVQLALYAHGVNTHGLFDWNTKTWQRYAGVSNALGADFLKVRTDIAIVVHLPADGDGCTLYVADIERGWRDAQRLGPLQASFKQKSRFRTLTAADLAPRPGQQPVVAPPRPAPARTGLTLGGFGGDYVQTLQATVPEPQPVNEHWNRAKNLVAHADSQEEIAQIYQFALDSGRFHQDQLTVLVGLGKDRLNALARG